MILRRLDDYQGWQVIHGDASILIDPWLTDEPITGSFDRRSSPSAVTLEQVRSESVAVAAIALCTAVSDHARPATLAAMPEVPVLGPARAARLARRSGSRHAEVMRPGTCRVFDAGAGSRLEVTATRTGLPLGLIAIGYLIQAVDSVGQCQGRIWIEPHQPMVSIARSLAPIDLALLPMQSVTATVMPVTASAERSLRAAHAARARSIVATATEPERDMTAWQRRLYRVSASGSQIAGGSGPVPPVLVLKADERMLVRPDESDRTSMALGEG